MASVGAVPSGARTADHRERILSGLGASIAEKGYAATTVADVARHARVSKRTFYEHFADKAAAFEALTADLTGQMLGVLEAATATDRPWAERLEAAVAAYLALMAASPRLTHTFLVELPAAGEGALRVRRQASRRYTDLLRRLTEQAAREEENVRPLTHELATAVAGGINELVLEAVEEERTERLPELVPAVSDLIRSVVRKPPD